VKGEVVVAGIGNAFRGDDGVGPAVAALVAEHSGARDIGPISEPLDLLGRFSGASLAVLVDATRSGAEPGSIRVVELDDVEDSPASSTHALGLRRVCRLAAALGEAPERVVVVGIEGEDFSDGDHLSAPVADAIRRAASRAGELIAQWKANA
jgi:hydrogenase maturation protease